MNSPDLLAKAIAEASVTKLLVIASHIEREARPAIGTVQSQLSRLLLRDPIAAVELLYNLRDEVAQAFGDLITDLRFEQGRRDHLAGKSVDQPRLYSDVGEVVGAGIRGTPAPQSDRTGA